MLVGINLLREGLDLPEVSLVAILDADKEGFLRSETSLMQTIGRAARHCNGTAILYADRMTGSIERAVKETDRRRAKQAIHNETHHITPRSIMTAVHDIMESAYSKEGVRGRTLPKVAVLSQKEIKALPPLLLTKKMKLLEKEMRAFVEQLEFEKAAIIRDQIHQMRALLRK